MRSFLKLIFLVGILLASFSFLFSQNTNEFYVNNIDTIDLRKHLAALASDDFEGRFTGANGQKKAGEYIRDEFIKMNCKAINNEFFQSFNLYNDFRSGSIVLNNQLLDFPVDFGFFNLYQTFNFELTNLIFVDQVNLLEDYSNFYLLIQEKDLLSINPVYETLPCKGLIFILEDYDKRYFSYASNELTLGFSKLSLPVLFINQKSLSKTFIQSLNKNKSTVLTINGLLNPNPEFISTENVIAYVEGSDSILKNEVVVISAHYDHLGVVEQDVFYGADDNGSGTSALLEIASAFQAAKIDGNQPKRSILFIAFSAEELGLLGSLYYSENPLIPLKNKVANLNIDMIGRLTKPVEKDSLMLVYIIGADRLSLEMDSLIKATNSEYTQLILDEEYNHPNEPQNLYYRSDHYNFATNGIPSCFFFGGFHDDYHEPSDTIEKIDFKKISLISQLVFHAAWKIADAPIRLSLID